MIIKSLLEELEGKSNPLARVLHKGPAFKILALGFKKGMIMKEHTAKHPARITILRGKVEYILEGKTITLSELDDHEIPMHIPHSVHALEDSLCLLSQG